VVIGTDCIGSCKSNYHMIMKTKFLVCENDSDIFIGNNEIIGSFGVESIIPILF